MPFIRGIKKGFKFEPIGKYTKEDIEVDVPEIVLPNHNPLGANQLDVSQQSNFKGINTTKIGMTRSNSTGVCVKNETILRKKWELQANIF